ncbi:hypothetical protein [Spirillospora sp. NPDC029432]|uniref:PD-(D/E)XK nuclease domain-containing protein n=1 Tax=Spirillospora sp. NPDC029432 TaxID=3154599 RepID=UPI003452F62B
MRQSQIDILLEKSRELEVLASKIQIAPRRTASRPSIDRLITSYHEWYAQALDIIPDEFKDRFRDEFEGGFFIHKIKAFLEAPGEASITYDPKISSDENEYWVNPFEKTFRAPLIRQRQVLAEVRQKIEGTGSMSQHILLIEQLCRNFPEFLEPLQDRPRERPSFIVEDEYDVQDALHALLRIFFDDVRPEDFVPEYGGAKSRVDFLLKAERIVIEVKMTRKGLAAKEIGEQLITDIARYKSHPDCGALVAFVYDPDRKIKNRRALESDLTRRHDGLSVYVYIVQ